MPADTPAESHAAALEAGTAAVGRVALHELATLTAAERDRLLLRAEDDLAPFLE